MPPQQLNEKAGLDYDNAYYLATASELAYGDDPDAFKDQLGLTGAFAATDEAQVFVGSDQTNLVLAFRGSRSPIANNRVSVEGLRDWILTDAMIRLVGPAGKLKSDLDALGGPDGMFHRGFMKALTAVWPQVRKLVEGDEKNEDRRVWLTGHSLGGALAVLATPVLDRMGYTIHEVSTYAAPMVCNHAAAGRFDLQYPAKMHRFIYEDDVVPSLPVWLGGLGQPNQYVRVQKEEFLSKPRSKEDPTLIRRGLDLLMLAAQVAVGGVHAIALKEITDRIASHSISDSYLPALDRARKK